MADRADRNGAWVLTGDPYVSEHAHIEIASVDGRVTVTGTIGSTFEELVAVADLASLPGVRGVENLLVVEGKRADIESEVEARLAADPLADATHTKVAVSSDGMVTLTGTVDTAGALQAATDDAERSGARNVVNSLRVRSSPGYAIP